MKLAIKKKYFDMIKSGEKNLEWRSAHITFVCEETGEKLTKKVKDVGIMTTGKFEDWHINGMTEKEFKEMFDDEYVLYFELR